MAGDTTGQHRFVVEPKSSEHFSWIRTRLSAERTMMSWTRTAIAMIGFGFTIVKFFESLQTIPGALPAHAPHAARYVGLALIGAGTCALAVSLWQYLAVVRYLWKDEFRPIAGLHDTPGHTPILWITIILILIGIFAFLSIVIRLP